MKVHQMEVGKKYKPTEKTDIKVANEEIDCRIPVSSGTVIVPIKINEKSVRVELRFRDKDKNFIARLPFADNYNLVEVREA